MLVTLSSISADALANTFFWLSAIGVNPLDHPGRTALMGVNTLGLILATLAMTLSFVGTVALGWLWAGVRIGSAIMPAASSCR